MYFILSTGEAVLSGRIPDVYFEMFMSRCRAFRLLIRRGQLSRAELIVADHHRKKICEVFYLRVYGNSFHHPSVCRFAIAALLNIVPNIRSCGPTWVWWQFPTERLIGTLPDLIGLQSEPHPSLTNAIHAKYQAQLIMTLGETFCPDEWADATKAPINGEDKRCKGTFCFPPNTHEQVHLLPPRAVLCVMLDTELEHLKTALNLEGVSNLPGQIAAIEFFRLELSNGVIAGWAATETARTRRDNLLQISLVEKRHTRRSTKEEDPVTVYGRGVIKLTPGLG